jgi:hypothetical protein
MSKSEPLSEKIVFEMGSYGPPTVIAVRLLERGKQPSNGKIEQYLITS